MERKTIFILILVLWIVLLIGFIGVKEFTLKSGEKVLLKTAPIDPRDMFRGDYIILNYEISSINQDNFGKRINFSEGDTVYVYLEKVGEYYSASDFSKTREEGKLSIKGRVKSAYGRTILAEYGIESYFVPEGEGRALEQIRNKGNLEVEAVVDQFGNAVISRLLANGNEVGFG